MFHLGVREGCNGVKEKARSKVEGQRKPFVGEEAK